jgi:hypothetical protein
MILCSVLPTAIIVLRQWPASISSGTAWPGKNGRDATGSKGISVGQHLVGAGGQVADDAQALAGGGLGQ